MRFLKGLICLTAVVFAISCMLSGIYIFRPDIPDKIETFFYPEQESTEMITENHDRQEETAGHPDESIETEETRQKTEAYETEETGQNAEAYETEAIKSPKQDAIAESIVSDYISQTGLK